MKSTRNTEDRRMGLYQNEFQTMLTNQCRICSIKGPLLDIENHNLKCVGNCFATHTQLYVCPACDCAEKKHMEMVMNVGAMLEGLSKAKPGDTPAVVAVEDEHPQTHFKRITK